MQQYQQAIDAEHVHEQYDNVPGEIERGTNGAIEAIGSRSNYLITTKLTGRRSVAVGGRV